MEAKWVAARYRLYELTTAHPDWSPAELGKVLGYSPSWVRKWMKYFEEDEEHGPDDLQRYLSRSRAPHKRHRRVTEEVEHHILEIRDHPPDNLGRVPGPQTILYYLHQDDALAQAYYLPKSTRTIWEILDRNQRIHRYQRPKPQIEERPPPMSHWQIDFKSVSTVPAEPDGKQQHVVETFNVVDKGSSILVSAQPHGAYNAETVIDALIEVFLEKGLPKCITCDRDPRFIGSWTAKDFPSPLMRLLMNLGIGVNICPPHRPDKNAFVERYHRSYSEECLAVFHPTTLEAVIDCTANYAHHYNHERPNQALSCGNQPPLSAWPDLPKGPSLPNEIDPDGWLKTIHGKLFPRKVNQNGSIQLGRQSYYVSTQLAKQAVLIRVHSPEKALEIIVDDQVIKTISIKGLIGGHLDFEDYLDLIKQEAVSDYQAALRKKRR